MNKADIVISLITGIISGILATIITNFVIIKKNEQKLLDEAIQIYIDYGMKVNKCLQRYNEAKDKKEALKKVEDIIDDYPRHIGFKYTNSNILKEFRSIIDDIDFDITSNHNQLNATKILDYCGKIQNIKLKMLKIKYDFFYKFHNKSEE